MGLKLDRGRNLFPKVEYCFMMRNELSEDLNFSGPLEMPNSALFFNSYHYFLLGCAWCVLAGLDVNIPFVLRGLSQKDLGATTSRLSVL